MRPPPNQFGADITNTANNEEHANMLAKMICTRLAGRAVIRVVDRCNEAQDNNNLDLSECQLMQVPDAVYHLMRHTELKACNLSSNVITKIPPKFAVKFSLITELNLSHNQMSKLPDELADLAELERLDISHNAFISLPTAAYKMPKLTLLNANCNHIIDIDVERLQNSPSLKEVDLEENPVPFNTATALRSLPRIRVVLSERKPEEWEDLTV
ncbi:leucine-rich repeat protein soc-2 isoform X1 [Cimex lectularius]|uniref:Leucine-rich repeat-containing protein 20 n=1 Tax=Cimex lectularius TaxID=79782 RepID=A0A8I6R732_CIMLE|nr:leucine-rich repeat protein soc-2 isoform X1 [Cimex lectularius]